MNAKLIKHIQEEEEQLFGLWSHDYPGFSPDGLVDPIAYVQSYPRLMFVLKETNGLEGEGVDLKGFLKNGGRDGDSRDSPPRKPTWDNIARWIHGLRNLDRDIAWLELEGGTEGYGRMNLDQWRDDYLQGICVINVKKSTGRHTAVDSELAKAAANDKEFLRKQFEIYSKHPEFRPHIIIGCGSVPSNLFDTYVLSIDKWQMTSRGIHYGHTKQGSLFVWYSHPAARVDDALLYYGLVDAVRKVSIPHII